MVKLLGWLNWWSVPTYVGERSRELILVGRGTVTFLSYLLFCPCNRLHHVFRIDTYCYDHQRLDYLDVMTQTKRPIIASAV